MRRVILGTAGHIDHGKTSFVKALTGIDTDRLKEEKERGITIELGFAYLQLGDDTLVGIVDVPGHERFVKHMVAGATGIDLVALIIAADEGVMPQTREHLEICELLGIKTGIVVLTKVDMVEGEWLELVREDVRAFLKGTFLEDSPIVEVSSITGQGLQDFIVALNGIVKGLPEREVGHIFRLPVDRVFTIKGFGTVVTGTTVSGKVTVGEEVTVYPHQVGAKIRSIQVHGKDVKEVYPGTRTALNLQGLEKTSLERGHVVATKDSLVPSYSVDCHLEILPSCPYILKNRSDIRFHIGTSEIIGKIVLLDRTRIEPGESSFVVLRLQEPISALRGDRFVIRSYSPMRTIGGGTIINPSPPVKRKLKHINLEHLKVLAGQDRVKIVEVCVKEAEYGGIEKKELVYRSNLKPNIVDDSLEVLGKANTVIYVDQVRGPFIHSEYYTKARDDILAQLEEYHNMFPLKAGIQKEELKMKSLVSKSPAVFEVILKNLIDRDQVVQEKDLIRLKSFAIKLSSEQTNLKANLQNYYLSCGVFAPTTKEVKEKFPYEEVDELLELLIREGVLVKVKDDLFFHKNALKEIQEKVLNYFSSNESLNAGKFKELTGLSRKYAIPLLEYFDRIQLTVRVGDDRLLRKK